eukprot:scaffold14.g1065.t1
MAEAALSKSLDDIIAEQRKKKEDTGKRSSLRRGERPAEQGERPPRGGRGGGGGGGSRRPRGGAGGAPPPLTITIKGGVSKARGGRGGERVDRQVPEARLAALEGNARWGHDLFDSRQAGGAPAGGRRRDPRAPTSLGTKLFVSNLDYNVSDEDIKELFGSVGTLVKAGIIYDNSGRSDGDAEVIFEKAADAERAVQRYNGVQLDGKPMQIELIPQGAPGSGAAGGARTLRSGIRVSGGGGGGGRVVDTTRSFQQALGGATRNPRGRGSIRGGGTAAMDME